MTKFNAANERLKHRYLQYLKDVKGRDDASIDGAAKAIHRFEEYTKHREFKKFHIEQARGFKAHLGGSRNARTGEPLSASTIHSTLAALKAFLLVACPTARLSVAHRYRRRRVFQRARQSVSRRHGSPIQGVPDGQSGSDDDRSRPGGHGNPAARPGASRFYTSLRRTRSGHHLLCPSSDDLRHVACFQKGGSGSSVFEIMRHAVDAASDGLRLSGV